MQILVRSLLSTVLFTTCVITCNKLDSNTTVGMQVIKEYDPTLVTYEKQFHTIAFDSSIISKAYSVPISGNKGFGTHANKLAVGSEDGVTTYGAVSFDAAQTFAERYATSRTFDSVTFVFDTLADSLYATDPTSLEDLRLYTTTRDDRFYESVPDTSAAPIAMLTPYTQKDPGTDSITAIRMIGSLTDSTLQDSILSLMKIFSQGDSCRSSCESDSCVERCDSLFLTESDSLFVFSLFSDIAATTWLQTYPGMVIHTTDTTSDTVSVHADTIWGTAYCVPIESDSLIDAVSPQPVSRFFTGRTAVFTLDIAALWDSLENSGFDKLLAAGVVLSTDSIVIKDEENAPTIFYLFTDKEIQDSKELSASFYSATTNRISYRDSLTDFNSDTLTLDVSNQLQNLRNDKPAKMYLYLQIKSTNVLSTQEVLWKKPQLKTVLTTIR